MQKFDFFFFNYQDQIKKFIVTFKFFVRHIAIYVLQV